MAGYEDGLSDDDAKDVYAHAGLALYKAQVLEEALVASMVVARFPERARLTRKDIDAFTEGLSKRTLGGLINEYKRWASVPATLEKQLEDALKRRNRLAHHYFKERTTEWYAPGGAVRMRDELMGIAASFDDATEQLDAVIKPMMEAQGITGETLEREMERMVNDARAAAPDSSATPTA